MPQLSFMRSRHPLSRTGGGGALLPALLGAALMLGACGPTRYPQVTAFGNMGREVNSAYDDYAPALPDTATLVFTSNRAEPGEEGLQQFYRNIRPTRLYFSMRLESDWDQAQRYRLFVDGGGAGVATISFAPSGSPFNIVLYLSACGRADSVGGCDIYAITERGEMAVVNLGKGINSATWDGHPYVTPDGTRLYFASDRPGGFGGSDIWISERLPSGAWGDPRNAGPAVNTAEDELSPFYDAVGERLLFAGKTAGSGLDIFELTAGGSSRRPLSAPYNSEADDFTPFLRQGTLYLSSNRIGGCGGYDLYAFPIIDARAGEPGTE